jgi:DNA replication protein DnaC
LKLNFTINQNKNQNQKNYESIATPRQNERRFRAAHRAYERISLVVTTNLPFEQWTEVLCSERLTGSLLDRLTYRVHILEINGQSYRLTDAKRRVLLPCRDANSLT